MGPRPSFISEALVGIDFNSDRVAHDNQHLRQATKSPKVMAWLSNGEPNVTKEENRGQARQLKNSFLSFWTTKFSFPQPKWLSVRKP